MAFWCYMLRCADGRFYTGHTDDLDRRMAQHHAGGFCDFTARRQPVALVWSENFPTRVEALAAERQLKGWSRAKKQALIAGDWALVAQLAAARGTRPSTSSGQTGKEGSPASFVLTLPNPVRAEPVEARAAIATLAR